MAHFEILEPQNLISRKIVNDRTERFGRTFGRTFGKLCGKFGSANLTKNGLFLTQKSTNFS